MLRKHRGNFKSNLEGIHSAVENVTKATMNPMHELHPDCIQFSSPQINQYFSTASQRECSCEILSMLCDGW